MDKDLYESLQYEARVANARLLRLKGFYGNTKTWAGKDLITRLSSPKLSGLSEKGFVLFNKNLDDKRAFAILRAVQKFNQAETSTVAGVENVKNKIKRSIANKYDISDEDANTIYDFMTSGNYDIINFDTIASELYTAVALEAKRKYATKEEFLMKLMHYIENPENIDAAMQFKLQELYQKYFYQDITYDKTL